MAYSTNNISLPEMSALTHQTYLSIVSSHRLLSRVEFPYYHNHPSVPSELTAFKKRITSLRIQSLNLVLERYKSDSDPMGEPYAIKGSFACSFTGSLAIAGLGLGECGECSAKLAATMIARGFGNITFFDLKFTKARDGMEQGHQLILANISQTDMPALRALRGTDFIKFIAALPAHAVIGDPFLNTCFTPPAIPKSMQDYIAAYGGEAIIGGMRHYNNLGPRFFTYYADRAGTIQKNLAEIPEAMPRLYIMKGPWKASLTLSTVDQNLAPKS